MRVLWRAFELRPDPVPTLDPRGEYLTRIWSASVYPMAERMGMTLRLPPVQPRSRRAHEAAHWARSIGHFERYNEALFRAFFERGEDIGQPAVLVELARRLQLDGEALARALEERTFEGSVLEDEWRAESAAVTGVPAFVFNERYTLTGVRSVEALRNAVDRIRKG